MAPNTAPLPASSLDPADIGRRPTSAPGTVLKAERLVASVRGGTCLRGDAPATSSRPAERTIM
ncbi:hypothetical protein OG762_28190 [Streptomyces sp. NBC_01136]|uniref:hypothetical protein n=1 Tax=unclassified Streptomyces TaxID=2593676 RepID=UPI00324D2DED|nr:hypothetical protein OG762_28190 [Streptomyces sp. NBC_01136]